MSLAVLEEPEETTAVAEPTTAKWIPLQFFDPQFKAHLRSELDGLRKLQPGWDGYHAAVIDPAIIDAAKIFVERLTDNIAPRPRVVPLASGALQFEWVAGEAALELEFESETVIHFLQWNPQAQVSEEATFSITDVDRAEDLIEWFTRRDA